MKNFSDQLSNLNFDESTRVNLTTRLDELDNQHRDIDEQKYNFYKMFDRLNLDHLLDPKRLPRNFDHTKIKGEFSSES